MLIICHNNYDSLEIWIIKNRVYEMVITDLLYNLIKTNNSMSIYNMTRCAKVRRECIKCVK